MTTAAARVRRRRATWRLGVAPLVWAAHFLALYAFTALACARSGTSGWFGIGAVPWFIGAVTLAAAAALLVTIGIAGRHGWRAEAVPEPAGFVRWLSAAGAGVALLAVLWEALAVIWVPVCA